MQKKDISGLLRKFRLLLVADYVRFGMQYILNYHRNNTFKKKNKGVAFPPAYLIYESFRMDYQKYLEGGRNDATWLVSFLQQYTPLKSSKILDWGCGPGRIIRHLPELTDSNNEYFGTDMNGSSIQWCRENLPEIQFNQNNLNAELPYPDHFFDIIYGISIFTHLSEQKHKEWLEELYRVLKPDGLLLITTQGNNFLPVLTPSEQADFQNGKLIVRGEVKEGHRVFSAFHPYDYMLDFLKDFEIVNHKSPSPDSKNFIPQDIWLVKKT